ncbi:hypothetical protein KJ766_03570 [Patescibacteria group bacterium]|nr:hypothetical protein [Patescibacteria group bacterium]
MTRKQIIEIIFALVLVLGTVAVILFFMYRGGDDAGEVDVQVEQIDGGVVTPEDEMEQAFSSLPHSVARSFVERFGSFSSESDYSNIEDVKQLSTANMQSRLSSVVIAAQNDQAQGYYGVSTRVMVIEIENQTDSSATLRITTQREESIDSPANTTIRYQDIILQMVWDGQKWLVDDFTWED